MRRPRRRDPHRPRHGLEILPAQQTQHHLTLAPGREPTPTAAPDSSTCFLISTLLLRELSRNQVSKKTLGRRRPEFVVNAMFLLRAWSRTPLEQRADCLIHTWVGNEGGQLNSPTGLKMFQAVRSDLRNTTRSLPPLVPIYRGVGLYVT